MAYGKPPHIIPLYGVILREAMASDDVDLKKSMLKVSEYLMQGVSEGVEDWKAAHQELAKAMS